MLAGSTRSPRTQNLATESGIESRTVAQWLHHLDHDDRGLAGISVLVLDGANLTDDRARLYDAAAAAGTKVVESGTRRGCGVWAAAPCSATSMSTSAGRC
jgi:hypothetical protein